MHEPRWKTNAGSVFELHYHFVWCPKYRLKVLTGPVEARLRELLIEKAAVLGVTVAGLEVMPDHVHLFVSAEPGHAPQYLANQFKGFTSRALREEFPHLVSRMPALWSRSYYVGSAGKVSAAIIQRYIANQKGRS